VAEAARRDVIRRENKRPGTTDWQLKYTRVDPATQYRCPWIEGYVSKASVRAGESLDAPIGIHGRDADATFGTKYTGETRMVEWGYTGETPMLL
jgi:hypothetical protein